MSFRLVPKSVTLNDLERRNGHYIALFLSLNLVNLCCRKRSVAEFMQESIVFLLRVQCKESSRSLSHLLMSFLLKVQWQHCRALRSSLRHVVDTYVRSRAMPLFIRLNPLSLMHQNTSVSLVNKHC